MTNRNLSLLVTRSIHITQIRSGA